MEESSVRREKIPLKLKFSIRCSFSHNFLLILLWNRYVKRGNNSRETHDIRSSDTDRQKGRGTLNRLLRVDGLLQRHINGVSEPTGKGSFVRFGGERLKCPSFICA